MEQSGTESTVVGGVNMKERLKKRRKRAEIAEDSLNCDFILGSVAEVDCLWRVAKYVISENRRRMKPQLLEAVVLLMMNGRLWDAELVTDAMYNAS